MQHTAEKSQKLLDTNEFQSTVHFKNEYAVKAEF